MAGLRRATDGDDGFEESYAAAEDAFGRICDNNFPSA